MKLRPLTVKLIVFAAQPDATSEAFDQVEVVVDVLVVGVVGGVGVHVSHRLQLLPIAVAPWEPMTAPKTEMVLPEVPLVLEPWSVANWKGTFPPNTPLGPPLGVNVPGAPPVTLAEMFVNAGCVDPNAEVDTAIAGNMILPVARLTSAVPPKAAKPEEFPSIVIWSVPVNALGAACAEEDNPSANTAARPIRNRFPIASSPKNLSDSSSCSGKTRRAFRADSFGK